MDICNRIIGTGSQDNKLIFTLKFIKDTCYIERMVIGEVETVLGFILFPG